MVLAREAVQRALALDPNEAMAHLTLGRVHLYDGESELAIGDMETAIAINPNLAWAYQSLGFALYYGAGRAEEALSHYDTALRLSPRDHRRWAILMNKGTVLRHLGRHDEAITYCRQACRTTDHGYVPHMQLTAALAEAGQMDEAQHVAVEHRRRLDEILRQRQRRQAHARCPAVTGDAGTRPSVVAHGRAARWLR